MKLKILSKVTEVALVLILHVILPQDMTPS